MNITVTVNTFPSISQTFILNQITGILDRGHSVKIIAHSKENEQLVHPVIREYDLLNRTTHYNLPFHQGYVTTAYSLIKVFLNHSYKYPRGFAQIALDLPKKPVRTAGRIFRSVPFIFSQQDIVHAHFGIVGRQMADLKHYGFFDDPLIISVHGVGIREGRRKGPKIYNRMFETADLLLANSESTRRELIEFGAPKNKTKLHRIGIDISKFNYAPPTRDESSDKIVILSVGRLSPEKGHDVGIRALANIFESNPDLNLEYKIIGHGPLRGELESLVKHLDLGEVVHFYGKMQHDDVRQQMQTADLFLHPSRSEGLGKVLLEAQACGLPIIATNAGGIPEAVRPCKSAYLVPPDDPGDLAETLLTVIQSPDSWRKMSIQGRRHVESKFDNRVLNDQLADYYKSLC